MEKLLLVDGHSILHRAYFGISALTNREGTPTNAMYGFLNILFRIIDEENPTHLAVAFDLSAPTFRHEIYPEYKGTRKPMEDDLRVQIPLMKELLRAMNITVMEKEGFEADDLLGTAAKLGEKAGMIVTVLSGDRDLLQLATENIKIRIPKTKKGGTEIEDYNAKDVLTVYGVTPEEFIEVKALQGDSSDNIPGLPGVGPKTATALVQQYHTVEAIIENKADVKPPKAQKALEENIESLRLCRKLVEIETAAPLPAELSDMTFESPYTQEAYELCRRYEFKHFLSRFDKPEKQNPLEEAIIFIEDMDAHNEAVNSLPKEFSFALSDEALALYDGDVVRVLTFETPFEKPMLLTNLRNKILESDKVYVIGLKELLSDIEITADKAVDTSLLAYVADPTRSEYTEATLGMTYAGVFVPDKKEAGELKLLGYRAAVALMAGKKLLADLAGTELLNLYETIELPLVYVLHDMEQEGIALDKIALSDYSKKLVAEIEKIETKIYEQTGEKFNINSPKQLGEILFEKMGIPGGKKTKTGYSTSADVLEKLAAEYPFVKDVLEYRQLTKLNSTYAEGLAAYIQGDGRIHCHFQQTVTATGRLSCTDPNLQNIPIRMELGRQIRKLFLPREGYVFVDADYSQIELRILAHLSQDDVLLSAFNNGQDVHRSTAAKVFGVPFEEVTDTQRRAAKVVNFGIIYGMSSFGLSEDLKISRKEAAEFTETYFATYPRIKGYLDYLVESARQNGYVESLYGRKRPIPDINNSNFMKRSFSERVAMNSPIQGTAADIMKIAMIRVHDRLIAEKADAKILVQVHDELLLEVKKEQAEAVTKMLCEEMEKAAKLLVPLEAEAHSGATWYEAK